MNNVNIQSDQTTDITIDFINERQGNRPASIKGSDGKYYTISDNAITSKFFDQHLKTGGTITFWTNKNGFKQASTWNGVPIPKDDKPNGNGANHQAPLQTTAPVQAPVQAAAPATKHDIAPGVAVVSKACIETGQTREEAADWLALGFHGKSAL